jgi:hypothetical protein
MWMCVTFPIIEACANMVKHAALTGKLEIARLGPTWWRLSLDGKEPRKNMRDLRSEF